MGRRNGEGGRGSEEELSTYFVVHVRVITWSLVVHFRFLYLTFTTHIDFDVGGLVIPQGWGPRGPRRRDLLRPSLLINGLGPRAPPRSWGLPTGLVKVPELK